MLRSQTLRYLHEHGAKTVILSHLGRPDGKRDPKYSLRPVGARLAELLRTPVEFRRRLRRQGCVDGVARTARRRLRALRERALSRRGRGQRSGVRARTRGQRRHLRQRRVRHRASRARLDRRRRRRSAGIRRLSHGGRTGRARPAHRQSGQAVHLRDRRSEGRRQGRRVRATCSTRVDAFMHRRRHGQHVSRRPRRRRRQIAARPRPRRRPPASSRMPRPRGITLHLPIDAIVRRCVRRRRRRATVTGLDGDRRPR